MVKILIMDDNENKRNMLRSLLQDECKIAYENIEEAVSVNSGRTHMCNKVYDLVIIDLVMPNYDNEENNREDAPRFIDEIYSNPSIKIPNQIIGFTAYADEFEEMKKRFEDKLWYLVHYEEGRIDWKMKVKNKVFHLLRNKDELLKSIQIQNKYEIGIVCALQPEYDQLLIAFGDNWETKEIDSFPLPFNVKKVTTAYGKTIRICAVVVGKAGMVATGIIATSMCNVFHVDKLFMTGFAAGVHYDDIRLGDIVVAKCVQDYSAGKLIKDENNGEFKLLKELQIVSGSEKLLNMASAIATNKKIMKSIGDKMEKKNVLEGRDKPQAFLSPTVCGPFVVASGEAIENIKEIADRKLQALDMEGFGLYLAAHYNKCECLWIKGISDFADTHKGDKFHTHCAYASALFLYNLIKESKV